MLCPIVAALALVPAVAPYHMDSNPRAAARARAGSIVDRVGSASLLPDPHWLLSDALAWADVDNDGLVDLAAGTDRQGTKLFRNTGSGTFAHGPAELADWLLLNDISLSGWGDGKAKNVEVPEKKKEVREINECYNHLAIIIYHELQRWR